MDSGPATTPGVGDGELRCPLCDYDVRGLPEPRCPECGHRFEWGELTDPDRMKLKWLFEHRRWAGGYVRTQVRSLWPWAFWRTVRPAHGLAPWRLAAYAMVAWVTMSGVMAASGLAQSALMVQSSNGLNRRVMSAKWSAFPAVAGQPAETRPTGWTRADEEARPLGLTGQQYIDRECPLFGMPGFWAKVYPYFRMRLPGIASFAAIACSPVLAALVVLGVMRQSFSRAKVRPAHALRVAVYAGDAGPMSLFLAAMIATDFGAMIGSSGIGMLPVLAFAGLGSLLLTFSICALRLEAGVRLYLGVRRAWVVAVAWGAITILVGMLLEMLVAGEFR